MERLIAKMGMNFKNGPTPYRGAGPNPATRRRHAFSAVAFLAALAVGLLFLLPGGLLQAQDSTTTIPYTENSEDPVATFTATDPEDATPITWSLATTGQVSAEADLTDADNADATDHFTIDEEDGMLKFSSPPDFENPSGEGAASNTYKVVVAACDVSAAACADGETGYHKVTVKVTNVEEEGKVTWTVDPDGTGSQTANDPTATPPEKPIIQFQVGAALVASVTDGDIGGDNKAVVGTQTDVVGDPTWRWYRSPSKTSMGTMIDGATSANYAVTPADVSMYLRVVVYYGVTGNVDQETASLTSDYPVLAARFEDNQLKFDPDAVSREVSEGDKGMDVGAPVTATGNHGAVNYTLTGADVSQFEIDPKTGQITTDVDLNFDSAATESDNCDTLNSCVVNVRATDASGDATAGTAVDNIFVDATVTIKITDVNEKPTFISDSTEGMSPTAIMREENITALADATVAINVTYAATDPEGLNVNLTLMGPDGDKFSLSSDSVLSFKTAPDYEMPGDADSDNVYMVTVRASDGTLHEDRMVAVTITGVNDAPAVSGPSSENFAENGTGAVGTFTAVDPEDATPITWSLATTGQVSAEADLTDADNADATDHFTIDEEDGMLKFSSPPDFENPSGEGAASNTYKVVVAACDVSAAACADGETGYHKVTVKVTNVEEEGKVTWTVDPDGTGSQTANDPTATPPEKPIIQFQVGAALVASVTDGDIGGDNKAVVGTDSDVVADPTWRWYRGRTLISGAETSEYTVTPADVGSRIRVVATYRFTDNTNQKTASLASDYPVLAARFGDNQLKFDPDAVSREVSEGDKGMDVGAPVTATGNHGAVNYTLTGADVSQFEIDPKTGQITTDVDLNFDSAATESDNCDTLNSCVVNVSATDASGDPTTGSATVTIKITDVNEKPTFPTASMTTISRDENMTTLADNAINVTYTATDPESRSLTYHLMGPDRGKFQLSVTRVLSFKTAPDYEMPGDADSDNVYMVTVRASDGTLHEDRMVAVTVTGVNEAPEIMVGGLAISGMSSVDHAEKDASSVAVYTATGPEADRASWSLEGDDAGILTIGRTDGTLRFRNPPDYEAPMDMGMDNMYMVTVKANDGTNDAMMDVTVRVTNVDELGMVSGDATVSYAEDRMVAVATYTATGPEAASANWSLSGADMDDFGINGRMLTFKASPDFETPMDADADNTYEVTVEANAGGEMDEVAVTVTVTNEDDMGRVTFWRDGADATTAAIMVGDELGGAVDDSDGNPGDTFPIAMYTRIAAANVTSWQWARSMDMTDWEDIGTGGMYTVMDGDAGYYLRATATYTDGEGMGKMASEKTMMVMMMNASPMFATETAERMVPETTAAGGNVGSPVTATDPDSGDTLTYTLSGTDMASFTVDNMGQIMVGAGTMLDYETKASYMVTVTASDGSASDSIDVMVMVTNEDEDGTVTLSTMQPVIYAPVTATLDDPDGMVTNHMWQWARSTDMTAWDPIADATDASYTPLTADEGYYLRVTVTYTDGFDSGKTAMKTSDNEVIVGLGISGSSSPSYAEDRSDAVETYSASGPESASAMWSLTGDDRMDFHIGNDGMLTFQSQPDFESPSDADMDNVYEITVHANDGTYMATHDVTVTVTNEDEMGEVTLWASATEALTMAPQVGDTITGAVMDPDGNPGDMPPIAMDTTINDVTTWQWARTMDTSDMSSWMDIQDATDAAYMVTSGDEGYYLRVMATYTDAVGTDTAYSMPTMMVAVTAEDPLLAEYDPDGDGTIERVDMGRAVTGFFADPPTLTREEMRRLVGIYFQ